MRQYLDLLEYILTNGTEKPDRTGVGTISVFGYQMRFDMADGFPLLTTKKVHFKSVAHELLWFISGDTNIEYLVKHNVRIWNEWPYQHFKKSDDYDGESMKEFLGRIKTEQEFAKKYGDLGPVYGKQWRKFEGRKHISDQLKEVVETIKKNPSSRRMIVSSWNPTEIRDMMLPPCHALFQFYVANNRLSLQLYQRSADVFLGVPFNIASYALLLHMVAAVTGYEPGEFIHTLGDTHIYNNHIEQVKTQLKREPFDLPILHLNDEKDTLFDFEYKDIHLNNYQSHPRIRAKVAV